jgi:hypothetical protein|tara:strand:- start:61 stop:486 length:426 start_codon:yes stop_codon:yes gene_type:complete
MPDPVKKKKKAQKKPSNMPGRAGRVGKPGKLKRKTTQTGYGSQNRPGTFAKKKRVPTTGPKKKISGGARAAEKIAKAKVMQKRKGGGSSTPQNKRSNKAMVDKKILAARSAYQKKHGSNSGGTDAQFKAYQANLNKIRKGY